MYMVLLYINKRFSLLFLCILMMFYVGVVFLRVSAFLSIHEKSA